MADDLERFLANARIRRAQAIEPEPMPVWGLAGMRGRLVELSAQGATATLTAAIELVAQAQMQGEPVAWLAPLAGTFYPPDVADSGVDLAALVVVRVADAMTAARSAERLLRSGGFGLVVIELSLGSALRAANARGDLAMAVQGRLVALAQAHDAAIVCLTDKSADAASLGSLISLRIEATRRADELHMRVLKDKRRGPGRIHTAQRRRPPGL